MRCLGNPGKLRTRKWLIALFALCWVPLFWLGLVGEVWRRLGAAGAAFLAACAAVVASTVLGYAVTVTLDPGVYRATARVDCAAVPSGTRYCAACGHVPPWGTKHCSRCDACVVGLDHHCDVLDACVGEGNQAFFEATVRMAAASFYVALGAVALSVAAAQAPRQNQRPLEITAIVFATLIFYLCAANVVQLLKDRYAHPIVPGSSSASSSSSSSSSSSRDAAASARQRRREPRIAFGGFDDGAHGRLAVFKLPRGSCCRGRCSYPTSLDPVDPLLPCEEEEQQQQQQPGAAGALPTAQAYLTDGLPRGPVVQATTMTTTTTTPEDASSSSSSSSSSTTSRALRVVDDGNRPAEPPRDDDQDPAPLPRPHDGPTTPPS